ncbi:hypothetical protein STEG23_032762, partial [Scotinomys teguina]
FIAKPCAIALNIQANGPQIAQPNAILEKVFTAITKHPDEKRLEGLSKQLDWDVRSIQHWFRQRRNQEKPSTLTRFCESISIKFEAIILYLSEQQGEILVVTVEVFKVVVLIDLNILYIGLWRLKRKMISSQNDEMYCPTFPDTANPGPYQTKSMALYLQTK